MLGWILIYFAKNPIYLVLSRVSHGIAGGGEQKVDLNFKAEPSWPKCDKSLSKSKKFNDPTQDFNDTFPYASYDMTDNFLWWDNSADDETARKYLQCDLTLETLISQVFSLSSHFLSPK